MPAQSKDRLHGTLDALILKTLSWGPRHGYAISRWLSDTSGEAIQVEEGSLYPALYRMERERWIEAEWGVSELGRKARFYKLTPKGRKQLAAETRRFSEFVQAVTPILLPEG
jgi:PadR family transcriptional regulator, regulatory protein PadR